MNVRIYNQPNYTLPSIADKKVLLDLDSETVPNGDTASAGEADAEPITGKYPALAREVRALMKGASHRAVARKTNVNFSTIGTMAKGDRSSSESTIKFARAYQINPNVLLRLSDLETVPEFDLIDWTNNRPLNEQSHSAPSVTVLQSESSAVRQYDTGIVGGDQTGFLIKQQPTEEQLQRLRFAIRLIFGEEKKD